MEITRRNPALGKVHLAAGAEQVLAREPAMLEEILQWHCQGFLGQQHSVGIFVISKRHYRG